METNRYRLPRIQIYQKSKISRQPKPISHTPPKYQQTIKPPIESDMGDVRLARNEARTKNKPAEKENRTSRISIRFTKTEYACLKSEAGLSGLTPVAFARKRIFAQRVASKADLAVLAELRRLGGLLKHAHNETRGAYSALTAQAIKDLSAYVRVLTAERQNNSRPENNQ
jgi:hypothetical protein